jgi:hypothetical protein
MACLRDGMRPHRLDVADAASIGREILESTRVRSFCQSTRLQSKVSFLDEAADLAFCGGKGALRVRELILDVGDRNCGLGSGFEFINVGCEALGGRFCKPKGVRGFMQGKEEDFAFHRFT